MVAKVFSGTSIILTSLYFARNKFLSPSLAQGASSLITLVFVLSFRSGLGIMSIAVGTLIGSLFQFFYLIPIILKKERYSFTLDYRQKEIVLLTKMTLPMILGAFFYRANNFVERFIVSRLGEGNISFLGYAFKIGSLTAMFLSQGISHVAFPRMSEHYAKKNHHELKEIMSKGIRALTIVSVPIICFILLARNDLVRILFERGNFTSQATAAVGSALLAYLGFVIAGSLGSPFIYALYSLKETTKAALIGVIGFMFYIIIAFILSNYMSFVGVALALSIQYTLGLIPVIYFIIKKIGAFETGPIFMCLIKSSFAGVITSIFLITFKQFIPSRIVYPVDLVILGGIGLILYFLLLILFRTEELQYISKRFQFKSRMY